MHRPQFVSSVRSILALVLLVGGLIAVTTFTTPTVKAEGAAAAPAAVLQPPSAFDHLEDPVMRSQALFVEAGKALLHPRCVNCHPAGDVPLQGEDGQLHQPWVHRGAEGDGVAGLRCGTCHQAENFDPGRVPGAPNWHLAPASMAWEGRTLAQLCVQLKDSEASGMELADVVRHVAEDPLVGWAWNPGIDREPPPGTQEQLGELIAAWVETGAACPE